MKMVPFLDTKAKPRRAKELKTQGLSAPEIAQEDFRTYRQAIFSRIAAKILSNPQKTVILTAFAAEARIIHRLLVPRLALKAALPPFPPRRPAA